MPTNVLRDVLKTGIVVPLYVIVRSRAIRILERFLAAALLTSVYTCATFVLMAYISLVIVRATPTSLRFKTFLTIHGALIEVT